MTLTFTDSEVPARQGGPGRPAAPNPYIDVVKALDRRRVETGNERLSQSAVVATQEEANKVKDLLQRVGPIVDRTVRVDIVEVAEGKDKGKRRVTFWTVPRIKHPEKTPEQLAAIKAKRAATMAAKKNGAV